MKVSEFPQDEHVKHLPSYRKNTRPLESLQRYQGGDEYHGIVDKSKIPW